MSAASSVVDADIPLLTSVLQTIAGALIRQATRAGAIMISCVFITMVLRARCCGGGAL